MQFTPVAQATLITSDRVDLPIATVEESSDMRLSLDLREDTSIPGDLIKITLDRKEEVEIIKLRLFKYWIDSKGMTKDKVDDLLMMLFYLDSVTIQSSINEYEYDHKFWKGFVPDDYGKPKYMLLNGMECRSVAVAGNLVEMSDPNDPEATYIDYYSQIMKQLYGSGWREKENMIVEAGLIKGQKEGSVYPYCILIDNKILKRIFQAVSQGIKVIVSDLETIKGRKRERGGWWENTSICYSDTPCDYKCSPQFTRYGIEFKKDENYSTVSSFVEPYITFQIDWNNLEVRNNYTTSVLI